MADPVDPSRRLGARSAVEEWINRVAMSDVVGLFGGDVALDASDAGDRVSSRLLALEEFGDFCWNFRRGTPHGVLHLLKRVLDPSFTGSLPRIATDAAWNGGDPHALLDIYFDRSSAVHDQLSADEGLRAEVDGYPDIDQGGYRERWEAVDLPFDPGAAKLVEAAAVELDIIEPGTPHPPYDHVLVLGGGGTSPLLRAEYAAEIVAAHDLARTPIWMLGSPRPLDEANERPKVAGYAPDAVDEFDLMSAAAQRAFASEVVADEAVATEPACGCRSLDGDCETWVDRFGTPPADMPLAFQHRRRRRLNRGHDRAEIDVLSASTSNPPDRPNTSDTYALFAEEAQVSASDRLLIVTSQVFVPFQRFDAIRMLSIPFGATVDVVGIGAARGDRPSTPEFQLQEILSGLRSARRLLTAVG